MQMVLFEMLNSIFWEKKNKKNISKCHLKFFTQHAEP